MRYAYHDLGPQSGDSTVVVRWRGGHADVLLLDPVNFSKYCAGSIPVRYSAGGRFRGSPARLTIPEDGRWYVVADLGAYSGNANATVEVLTHGDEGEQTTGQEALLEADPVRANEPAPSATNEHAPSAR